MHHVTPTANGSHPLRQGLRLSQGLLTLITCVVLCSFLQLEFDGKLDSNFQAIRLVEVLLQQHLFCFTLTTLVAALIMCDYDEENMCFTCSVYPDLPPEMLQITSVLSGLGWPLASLVISLFTPNWPILWTILWYTLHVTNALLWCTSSIYTLRKLWQTPR
ncbi:hypothetical protein DSO57_1030419 [Entomophthora muscae]|uniref:Uncharacterized protein n=1 Tax=Entomophthora muscae TaxID=34485 RepID=A0ACC2SDW5_9FUNG|nr:hypothetical protein DSO57_1030419 [Entomophthora muscae]